MKHYRVSCKDALYAIDAYYVVYSGGDVLFYDDKYEVVVSFAAGYWEFVLYK